MRFNKFTVTGFALLLAPMAAADTPEPRVRLLVVATIMAPKLVSVPEGLPPNAFVMLPVAQLLIENCGSEPVKIPTRLLGDNQTPSGMVSQSTEPGEGKMIFSYSYAMETSRGKKLQPSEYAFNPVVLMPGEIALVARWRADTTYVNVLPDEFHRVKFTYRVEPDLAAKFGWWAGEIQVDCDFLKLPDYPKGLPDPNPKTTSR